jgi:hypothetical protein
MRWPSKPEAARIGGEPVSRDPSYPDRARIDSDVRAFLRPASSPWIVFDRDSRIDDFAKSALRVGAVFVSSPSLLPTTKMDVRITDPGAPPQEAPPPMFPPSPAPMSADDPSTVALSSDLSPKLTIPPELAPRPRRARIAIGIAGLLAVAAAALLLVPRSPAPSHRAAAASFAASIELPSVVEQIAFAPPAPAPRAETPEPKKKFGRLVIKADPKTKHVWFDGKRMLGAGTRSFLVFCGMHTIAINDKADTKDIEVPCNGEYVAK